MSRAELKPSGAGENTLIINNGSLAALTLFIATSKPEEARIVKQLAISMLNRNI